MPPPRRRGRRALRSHRSRPLVLPSLELVGYQGGDQGAGRAEQDPGGGVGEPVGAQVGPGDGRGRVVPEVINVIATSRRNRLHRNTSRCRQRRNAMVSTTADNPSTVAPQPEPGRVDSVGDVGQPRCPGSREKPEYRRVDLIIEPQRRGPHRDQDHAGQDSNREDQPGPGGDRDRVRQRRGRARRAAPERHRPHGGARHKARRANWRSYPLRLLAQCDPPAYPIVRRSCAALIRLPAAGIPIHATSAIRNKQ